jgi:hypothetical protein
VAAVAVSREAGAPVVAGSDRAAAPVGGMAAS